MTIQYASDLHLEFTQNKLRMAANPLKPKGNMLLLAGDIVPFVEMEKHKDFFKFISENWGKTYWVPGNHEYYGFDVAKRQGSFIYDVKPNVHLVNNHAVLHGDTRFIFSTLWSKISPANEWNLAQNVSDFWLIRDGRFKFTPSRFTQLHEESVDYVFSELAKPHEGRTVVVTHHVPTLMNYPQQYLGSSINQAFATELHDRIADHGPDVWIYGHHHAHVPEFSIGKTQLLTNQLGYVQYGEHGYFDVEKTIEWQEG